MPRGDFLAHQDLRIGWQTLWQYSEPDKDVKWDKHFAVDLTAAGGADPDAVILIGTADKARPRDVLQIWTIDLVPTNIFSRNNVTIEFEKLHKGEADDFQPERKAQQTVDVAVTWDWMNPRDFILSPQDVLRITFTNFSALGPAGYEGHIVGRIMRGRSV